MPEHVLTPEVEIITDGGRRRRWTAAEKLRIVGQTLDGRASISVVAWRNGVGANLLWRGRIRPCEARPQVAKRAWKSLCELAPVSTGHSRLALEA